MLELIQEIKYQLGKPSHIVKVSSTDKSLRLTKSNGNPMRFSFSKEDILNKFSSLENFIQQLSKQGFKSTEFHYQRVYGQHPNITYHTMKKTTVNIDDLNIDTALNNVSETQSMNNQPPSFLGSPQMNMDNMHFLGAMVKAERSEDYKKQVTYLEERVKDLSSEKRMLREENSNLKRKLDTSEDRAELKLKTELLERKSFFESDGFQKLAEGLGGVLPSVLPALINGGNQVQPTQLGSPETDLSPVKKQVIQMISSATEDQAVFIAYVAQHYSDKLVETLNNHIENGE